MFQQKEGALVRFACVCVGRKRDTTAGLRVLLTKYNRAVGERSSIMVGIVLAGPVL
jgi:hypothetical protein